MKIPKISLISALDFINSR